MMDEYYFCFSLFFIFLLFFLGVFVKKYRMFSILMVLFLQTFFPEAVYASSLKIAVTPDFNDTLQYLSRQFMRREPGVEFKLVVGVSLELLDQVMLPGSNFDLLFSPDIAGLNRLQEKGMLLKDSRKTYAFGRLAFWISPHANLTGEQKPNSYHSMLKFLQQEFPALSITNSTSTIYGNRSVEVLKKMGVYHAMKKFSLIHEGDDVYDVLNIINGGSALIGILPESLILSSTEEMKVGPHNVSDSNITNVPDDHYEPVELQLAILTSTNQSEICWEFLNFILSAEIQLYIASRRYTPVMGLDDIIT